MVYVLNKNGRPLMPTERYGKVRRMLKDGRAIVVTTMPFTIKLTYETTGYTQSVTLGIDSGYQTIGFSSVTAKKELIVGECRLITGQVERNTKRVMYRRQRRNQLRYRAPRFDNRNKPEGWLAPSIRHKLDSHIRLIEKIKTILPVTEIEVQVASFDIQAIKNPGIQGKEYQQGEQAGYWNLREYILHRDGHQCQNPDCNNKSKEKVLEVHHIGYWKRDRTDRPGNLTTLCDKCHRSENHKEGRFLYGWEPCVKSFKPETFMTTVRWRLVNTLGCRHTYGYITKSRRIALRLEKSHINDAFCIAGGTNQARTIQFEVRQMRRNNRSLEYFYDSKHIDIRTGERAGGQELNSGRRTRNRKLDGENLRQYRGEKLSRGRRSIRKQRYPIQPGDVVKYTGEKYISKGIQNLGAYIRLGGLSKPIRIDQIQPYRYAKGLFFGV